MGKNNYFCGDGIGIFWGEWVFVLGEKIALWDSTKQKDLSFV